MSGQAAPDNRILQWRLLLAAVVICLAAKLYLGSILDLYSDEVFYWLASTKPAIAYSDLPFMTSLLAGLGSNLSLSSTLALRSFFIVLGSMIPLLVYWIALPLTGKRSALESALFSLCLPLGGFLGLLAVPDVPLVVLGLLSFGYFERAIRTNKTDYWILTGLFVALGFCTHYRFVLYPASAILFLSLCRNQRYQWQNSKLWLAFAIASVGLVPIIWFNLSHDLSSANFYFVDRHPWQFQTSGLLHIFKQAGLVTPPLYALFIFTLINLFKKTRDGETYASLLFYFSITHLLTYMLLAPWSDGNSTSIHWPLSGYFPLLIALPHTLRQVANSASQKWHPRAKPILLLGIPILGFLGTLTAFIGIGSQAFQEPLQQLVGRNVLSNKMAGWKEFNMALNDRLSRYQTEPTLITDNYYTAAQIEFAGTSEDTYTVDENKAVSDGRITQLNLWQKDSEGLVESDASEILFITEDSTLNIEDKEKVLAKMCMLSEELSWDSTITLFQGDKRFSVYTGTMLSKGASNSGANPCPYPARAWIDSPQQGDVLTGDASISGWAFNQSIGIKEIHLLVDNMRVGKTNYGQQRQDVASIYSQKTDSDPNSPFLGFSYVLDSSRLPQGKHRLELEIVNQSGEVSHYGNREIIIAH